MSRNRCRKNNILDSESDEEISITNKRKESTLDKYLKDIENAYSDETSQHSISHISNTSIENLVQSKTQTTLISESLKLNLNLMENINLVEDCLSVIQTPRSQVSQQKVFDMVELGDHVIENLNKFNDNNDTNEFTYDEEFESDESVGNKNHTIPAIFENISIAQSVRTEYSNDSIKTIIEDEMDDIRINESVKSIPETVKSEYYSSEFDTENFHESFSLTSKHSQNKQDFKKNVMETNNVNNNRNKTEKCNIFDELNEKKDLLDSLCHEIEQKRIEMVGNNNYTKNLRFDISTQTNPNFNQDQGDVLANDTFYKKFATLQQKYNHILPHNESNTKNNLNLLHFELKNIINFATRSRQRYLEQDNLIKPTYEYTNIKDVKGTINRKKNFNGEI
ncbi:hypothetical protein A3Q56_00817 [Intoshia linei]|uniref:Uncharacterized protein n=1 Tax=Intoshia linei TaxID=1819745 RepID=A0A177BAY8_9BILA|nr:hypothetical protein A3Q56_00817 [Intoshia linei]